jgi:branched-chain amino acid aminotransferase
MKYYFINRKKIKSDEAKISVDDYGLMRGYGIFETIKFKNKKALNINHHMDRLFKSISLIKINLQKIIRENIIADINEVIKINDLNDGLIKIIITKGLVENKEEANPNIYITINKLYPIPKGPVKVTFYNESKYPILRFNPAIKSINYLGNMMAIEDANNEGAFEVVFYNNNNAITECAMRNIFFIKDNQLITPALELGILPGTTRKIISKLSSNINLEYSEEEVSIDNVDSMDEAFICSSVVGVLPCYWDGWKSNYKITKKLQFLLEESLQK